MSDTAVYKLGKFISSGEPLVKLFLKQTITTHCVQARFSAIVELEFDSKLASQNCLLNTTKQEKISIWLPNSW